MPAFTTTHVALLTTTQCTPQGAYCVDADALRKARQGTPSGEYHGA